MIQKYVTLNNPEILFLLKSVVCIVQLHSFAWVLDTTV